MEILEDRLTPATVVSVTPNPTLIVDATAGTDKLLLTVLYSAEMNTAVNPTISFPVENPATTLTFSSGAWSNATTYVAKYNVADANVLLADVDVKVSGGQAADTTVPVDATFVDNFDIDTQNPTVTSVTPSVATITDAQVGAAIFKLTIVYSETMNTAVNPTVAFPTENPSTTITFASGSWTNSTTFVASYNVADVGAALADVDVRITGAQDANGNTQVQGDFANNFDIDTQNPTVTGVTVTRRIVADTLIGKKTFVIDVKFSEAMDQTVDPLVRFPEEKPGATLRHQSGAWLNATTYRDKFNVRDMNILLENIDIRVTGAKDLAGNTQTQQFDKEDFFRIDTRNPKIVSFQPIGFNGASGILHYALIFDLPVTGLNLADLQVEADGLSGAAIDSITGSGTQYQIGVFVGSGFGQIRLKLNDDNSIRFLNGFNHLEGSGKVDGGFITNSVDILHIGGFGFML